jgi:phage terminase small subunit
MLAEANIRKQLANHTVSGSASVVPASPVVPSAPPTSVLIEASLQTVIGILEKHANQVGGNETKRQFVKALIPLLKKIGCHQDDKTLVGGLHMYFAAIEEYDRATQDLIEGAELEAYDLAAQLEEKEKTTHLDSNLDEQLKLITDELSRRQTWSENIRVIQENLENTRDKHQEELNVINQQLKHEAYDDEAKVLREKTRLTSNVMLIENTIGTIIKILSENDAEVEQLIAFQRAIATLQKGLPQNIIGKELPALSDIKIPP